MRLKNFLVGLWDVTVKLLSLGFVYIVAIGLVVIGNHFYHISLAALQPVTVQVPQSFTLENGTTKVLGFAELGQNEGRNAAEKSHILLWRSPTGSLHIANLAETRNLFLQFERGGFSAATPVLQAGDLLQSRVAPFELGVFEESKGKTPRRNEDVGTFSSSVAGFVQFGELLSGFSAEEPVRGTTLNLKFRNNTHGDFRPIKPQQQEGTRTSFGGDPAKDREPNWRDYFQTFQTFASKALYTATGWSEPVAVEEHHSGGLKDRGDLQVVRSSGFLIARSSPEAEIELCREVEAETLCLSARRTLWPVHDTEIGDLRAFTAGWTRFGFKESQNGIIEILPLRKEHWIASQANQKGAFWRGLGAPGAQFFLENLGGSLTDVNLVDGLRLLPIIVLMLIILPWPWQSSKNVQRRRRSFVGKMVPTVFGLALLSALPWAGLPHIGDRIGNVPYSLALLVFLTIHALLPISAKVSFTIFSFLNRILSECLRLFLRIFRVQLSKQFSDHSYFSGSAQPPAPGKKRWAALLIFCLATSLFVERFFEVEAQNLVPLDFENRHFDYALGFFCITILGALATWRSFRRDTSRLGFALIAVSAVLLIWGTLNLAVVTFSNEYAEFEKLYQMQLFAAGLFLFFAYVIVGVPARRLNANVINALFTSNLNLNGIVISGVIVTSAALVLITAAGEETGFAGIQPSEFNKSWVIFVFVILFGIWSRPKENGKRQNGLIPGYVMFSILLAAVVFASVSNNDLSPLLIKFSALTVLAGVISMKAALGSGVEWLTSHLRSLEPSKVLNAHVLRLGKGTHRLKRKSMKPSVRWRIFAKRLTNGPTRRQNFSILAVLILLLVTSFFGGISAYWVYNASSGQLAETEFMPRTPQERFLSWKDAALPGETALASSANPMSYPDLSDQVRQARELVASATCGRFGAVDFRTELQQAVPSLFAPAENGKITCATAQSSSQVLGSGLFEVPAIHDDFVGAALIANWGWGGALIVVAFQGLIVAILTVLAFSVNLAGNIDRRLRLLANSWSWAILGCATTMLFQFVFSWSNIFGLFPVFGQPMTFFSFGSSHLLFFALPALLAGVVAAKIGTKEISPGTSERAVRVPFSSARRL